MVPQQAQESLHAAADGDIAQGLSVGNLPVHSLALRWVFAPELYWVVKVSSKPNGAAAIAVGARN
ncbi:MAG: hypothetical protein Kow00123_06290 [Anaerolineales bacterium]